MGNNEITEMMQMLESSLTLALIESIPSMLISVATYILTALSMYTIAKRRGIHRPWLAWIPIANLWMMGCISDQYRFVALGEVKSRRKVLLWTAIPTELMAIGVLALCGSMLMTMFQMLPEIMVNPDAVPDAEVLEKLLGPVAGMMVLCIPLMVVGIINTVFYYIALHDIFKSCEPSNSTLYLVLSILIGITLPIFLMVCRNKDLGMPSREPAYVAPVEPVEPWESSEQA